MSYFEILMENKREEQAQTILSYASIMYWHLLKWKYQPFQRKGDWVSSIINSRNNILPLLFTDIKRTKVQTNVYNRVKSSLFQAYINSIIENQHDLDNHLEILKAIQADFDSNAIALSLTNFDSFVPENINPSLFQNFDDPLKLVNINWLVYFMMNYILCYQDPSKFKALGLKYLQNNITIQKEYSGQYKGIYF